MIRLRSLRVLPGVFAIVAAAVAPALAQSENPEPPEPNTPIEHVIYLMQENHSFDNYFATYPGANGIPEGVCMPVKATDPTGPCVEPFHIGDNPVLDLAHNNDIHIAQFDMGEMNGFVSAHTERGADGTLAMGYYNDEELPFYWNVADNYVLFDGFFSSAAGGSVWNHLFWVTGTPGNPEADAIPDEGFGDLPTIFDRLEEAGVSWKFYVQNYDPTITYRNRIEGDRGSQVVWVPLLAYGRYLDDPDLFSKIVDLDEYYDDVRDGTLPAVSFMVPSGASEHPPGSLLAGQRFVRTLITELMRSDLWDSSAFLWTYDDWGGWYDHVQPEEVDEYGYGFRVPALMVSPYAREGHIESTTLDYTSLLRFVEDNWDLQPLADRDAKANSIIGAFDFEAPPREAAFLPWDRPVTEDDNPPAPSIFYVTYGLGALVPLGLAIGARGRRRTRQVKIS